MDQEHLIDVEPDLEEEEEELRPPRATQYRVARRHGRFYMLCVWAMYEKARQAQAGVPKIDMVLGHIEERQYVWRNTYNDEVVINACSFMRGPWELIRETTYDYVPNTTRRALSPVELVGLSVGPVMRKKLGDDDILEVLSYLPIAGTYEADRWTVIKKELDSLRVLERHPEKGVLSFNEKKEIAMKSAAIRNALKALETKCPRAPKQAQIKLAV